MPCCCNIVDGGAMIMLLDGLCPCGDAEFDATNGVNEVVVDVVVLDIRKRGEDGVTVGIASHLSASICG